MASGFEFTEPGSNPILCVQARYGSCGNQTAVGIVFSKELDLMPVVSSFITRKMGNGEATKLSKRILAANAGRSILRMALTGKTLYRELLLS